MQFNSVLTIISDEKKQCNRQIIPHPTTVSKDKRQLRKHLQKLPHSSMQFTEKVVNLAIGSTKNSKAFGSDNIAPVMLNHLEPTSIAYITRVKNLSVSTLSKPSLWKIGRIIPILKPNKSPDQSTSYRPIN